MIKQLSINARFLVSLTLIFIGIITLVIIIFDNQQKMKHQITTLYFGSLVPIKNLQEIVIILNRDVALQSFIEYAKKSLPTLSKKILSSDKKISLLWNEYATKWKSVEEKKYISYVDNEMFKLHNYLLELSQIVLAPYERKNALSFDSLQRTVVHIEALMDKLIEHETGLASRDRKEFVDNYESKNIILALIVLLVLVITLILFLNIKILQSKLVLATEDLHQESIRDGLTGLFNRRYFDQIFPNELKRAKRDRHCVSFMMIDIDHFKKYNDTYGHAKGDDVIKAVAQHLKEHFKRSEDLIFRLGGEEFGVFVHTHTLENVSTLARNLIDELPRLNIEHAASPTKPYLTLSMGMVFVERILNEADADLLYTLSDEALYASKENGRNQLTVKSISF